MSTKKSTEKGAAAAAAENAVQEKASNAAQQSAATTEVEALKRQLAEERRKSAALATKLKETTAELQVAEKVRSKRARHMVAVGKERYIVRCGVTLDGKRYTKDDLVANPTVCARLLANGSGIFKKLNV